MSDDSGAWTVATNRRHDRKKAPNKRKMTEEELRAYQEKEDQKVAAQRQKAMAAAAHLTVPASSGRRSDADSAAAVAAAVAAASTVPKSGSGSGQGSRQTSGERGGRGGQKGEKKRQRTRCVLIASSEAEKNELVTAVTGRNCEICATLFAPSAIANFPSGGATPVASVEEAAAAMERSECVVALAAGYAKKTPRMAPEVAEVAKHVLGAGYLVEIVSVDRSIPKLKKNPKGEPFKLLFDLSPESKKELIHVLGLSPDPDVKKAYLEAGLVEEGAAVSDDKKCVIDVFPELLNSSVTTVFCKDFIEGCKKADDLIQNIAYLLQFRQQPFYAFQMEFFSHLQSQLQQRTTPGKEEKDSKDSTRTIFTIAADGSAPIADGAAAFLGDRRSRHLQIVVNKYAGSVPDFVPEKEKMVVTFDRMIIAHPASKEGPVVELLLPNKEAQEAVIERFEARESSADE